MTRVLLAMGLAVAVCCGVGGSAQAGEFNQVLSIGDAAPSWKELPGTDDNKHSLADLKAKLVVVVFTCNTCPYAIDYEQRINELAQRYAKDKDTLAVVAINCNKQAEDKLPAMKKRAKDQQYAFAYLHDASQQTAKDFGATRTPEFFLLDAKRRVVYMGAMDDSAELAKVKTKYLEDAIEATLAGKEVPVAETAPIGCAIRIDRRQRRK